MAFSALTVRPVSVAGGFGLAELGRVEAESHCIITRERAAVGAKYLAFESVVQNISSSGTI